MTVLSVRVALRSVKVGNRKAAGLRSTLNVTFWGFRCVSQADLVERAKVMKRVTCS